MAGTPINVIKVAADDKVEIEQQIDKILLSNNIAITGRNAADSADLSLIKADASDNVVVGDASTSSLTMTATTTTLTNQDSSSISLVDKVLTVDVNDQILKLQTETLADNTAVAASVPNFSALAADESAIITYFLIRNGETQVGQLMIDNDNSLLVEEVSGDDVGVTFSNNAGQLEYVTTSTGNTVTMKLKVVRG